MEGCRWPRHTAPVNSSARSMGRRHGRDSAFRHVRKRKTTPAWHAMPCDGSPAPRGHHRPGVVLRALASPQIGKAGFEYSDSYRGASRGPGEEDEAVDGHPSSRLARTKPKAGDWVMSRFSTTSEVTSPTAIRSSLEGLWSSRGRWPNYISQANRSFPVASPE